LREKIGSVNRDAYYSFLARLLLYEPEQITEEIYQFYLRDASRGITCTSPITRTKCVTILSYFSKLRLEPILPLLPIIEKQCGDNCWELQGQILILCANALMYFNEVGEPDSPTKE